MHRRTFTVRGRGAFPLEMLCLDNCRPRRLSDVDTIRDSVLVSRGDNAVWVVQLVKHVSRDFVHNYVSEETWAAHGWKVVRKD